jgi:hypothetical protein
MALLFFHMTGVTRVVVLVCLAVVVVAFLDLLFRPGWAFVAADKQPKGVWIMLFVLGSFVPVIGVPGALLYFFDVRPAVIETAAAGRPAATTPKATPPKGSSSRR